MEFRKTKRVKLTGKYLKALYKIVYKRDAGQCVCCGAPVEYGVKFHHEPCGAISLTNRRNLLCSAQSAIMPGTTRGWQSRYRKSA